MSLSAWERQALDSIKDGLASSDPRLAARLDIFTRLASGEEMPPREKIEAGWRRSRPRPRHPRRNQARGPAHRMYQRLGLSQALLLVWLVVTVAMIMVSLASDRGGSPDACTASWARSCTGPAAAPDSALGPPAVLGAVLRNAQTQGDAAKPLYLTCWATPHPGRPAPRPAAPCAAPCGITLRCS